MHGIPIGAFPPAVGATVEIFDVDTGGNGDDLIWSGQTDSNGAFSGTSSNWEDYNAIRILPGTPFSRDQQVPDLLLLKAVVSQNTPAGRQSQVFPFPQGLVPVATAPLILPWAAPVTPITKADRALIVVTQLVGVGPGNWLALYQFLNAASVILADGILAPSYRVVTRLTGAAATKQGFINALRTCGNDPSIREIDVVLNLHGSDERLFFQPNGAGDGGVTMATLKSDLQALNLSGKLRLLYSTACFGTSHNNEFVEAGFNTAVGAVGVNADSATEYPTVLTLWASGRTIGEAINLGTNPLMRVPQDAMANALGFAGANSTKTIFGDSNITISSPV